MTTEHLEPDAVWDAHPHQSSGGTYHSLVHCESRSETVDVKHRSYVNLKTFECRHTSRSRFVPRVSIWSQLLMVKSIDGAYFATISQSSQDRCAPASLPSNQDGLFAA